MTSKDHIHRVYLTVSALRQHNPIPDKLITSEALKNGLKEDILKMVLYGQKRKKEPDLRRPETKIKKTEKVETVKDKAVKVKRMSYKELKSQPLYSLKQMKVPDSGPNRTAY